MDIIAREQAKIASQIFYCLVKSVDKSLNVCTIVLENKEYIVPFYGGAPIPNRIYSVFLPQNNMNHAFVVGEAVAKTGDTMTGNLEVVRNQEANIYVENTESGREHRVSLCAGASGKGGIYDETFSKWLIYYDKNGALGLGTPLPISSGGTGATTAVKALLNLGTADFNQGTNIPNNSDLDNYTTPGTYYVLASANAATITHTPTTSNGYKLFVFKGSIDSRRHQWAFVQATNTVYTRARDASTWTSWVRLVTDDYFPLSVSRGGTGATTATAALTNLGAAPMPTVVVDNTTFTGETVSKNYTVSGNGVVIAFVGSYSDSSSDYGTFQADISYDGTVIMGEGTRWGSNLGYRLGASCSAPIAVTNGKKIELWVRNTKAGTKYLYRRFICFGCTVS